MSKLLNYIIRDESLISRKKNLEHLHTFLDFPIFMGCTLENIDKDIYTIEPTLDNQEINSKGSGGLSYWEGSCRVRDLSGKIIGNAYLELTGYSKKR